jgi:hypothetical protein
VILDLIKHWLDDRQISYRDEGSGLLRMSAPRRSTTGRLKYVRFFLIIESDLVIIVCDGTEHTKHIADPRFGVGWIVSVWSGELV